MNLENIIIDKIKSNEKIKRYRELEEIINNNESINEKINNLKQIQKQIVHAKEYKKETYLAKLENEYATIYENITKHPIMAEYLDLQEEINNLLKDFSNIVEKGVNGDFTAKIDKK
ncbi:MAG TPA: hypothetical protein GX742_02155 [Acholeplasmataceae bacterium]|nr:hypothetical protein [Acholeplasmataceae bacterium]